MSAARKVCRQEADPDERLAVVMAAVWPSAQVYFVAAGREAA